MYLGKWQRTYYDAIYGVGRPAPKNAFKIHRPRRYVHCARRWIKLDDYEPFQFRKLAYRHHCRRCATAAHPFHRNRQRFSGDPT